MKKQKDEYVKDITATVILIVIASLCVLILVYFLLSSITNYINEDSYKIYKTECINTTTYLPYDAHLFVQKPQYEKIFINFTEGIVGYEYEVCEEVEVHVMTITNQKTYQHCLETFTELRNSYSHYTSISTEEFLKSDCPVSNFQEIIIKKSINPAWLDENCEPIKLDCNENGRNCGKFVFSEYKCRSYIVKQ